MEAAKKEALTGIREKLQTTSLTVVAHRDPFETQPWGYVLRAVNAISCNNPFNSRNGATMKHQFSGSRYFAYSISDARRRSVSASNSISVFSNFSR